MQDVSERVAAVTGANGFIGRHVCEALARSGWRVRAMVRRAGTAPACALDVRAGVDIARGPDWNELFDGTEVVVHCAGIAHTVFEDESRARAEFTRVNRDATVALGRGAVEAGVSRFVFLSSIGVYGDLSPARAAVESMTCEPTAPYARSKLEAERELDASLRGTATALTVVRPPLVYGPDCPGNFARLVRLVDTGLPLPFGRIDGRRHVVSVDNLVDLIVSICEHGGDARGCFNVADADAVGLRDIVRAIGAGLARPARLWNAPPSVLRHALRLVGRHGTLDKLSASAIVDTARARERFGWVPNVDSVDGMRAAAASFGRSRRG